MKKQTLLFLVFVFIGMITKAQTTEQTTIQEPTRLHYDSLSLNQKSKLELTKIFLEQVQILNGTLPYSAFPLKGQGTAVTQLDVPVSNYTSKKRNKVAYKVSDYNELMNESLYEIIPYSDKHEIIKGILFVQEMIERLDKGL